MRIPAADLPALVDVDRVRPRSLVVLDLPAQVSPEVLAAARASRDVLVGVCAGPPPEELLDHLALTLVPDGENPRTVAVPDLEAAVEALTDDRPQAACVLVQLLRLTAALPVREALLAESFAYSTLQAGSEHRAWLASRTPRPLPPDRDPVQLTRTADLLSVRLSRPERRNAVSAPLRDALLAALDLATWEPGLRVELSGAGPCFSSGGDLDEFGTATDPAAAHLLRTTRSLGLAVHALRDRVTVLLHGPCVGAGVEVPLFASRVVAAPGTTLRLPELSMGMVPGAGGTVSVPRRAGRWRAAWMVLSGQPVDAQTALTWGLIDAVE